MKKIILLICCALFLTACSSGNIPEGADARAWTAGNNVLQILDDWEDNGDNPNEDGIAVKIMKQVDSCGFFPELSMKNNKSEKEQYICDMYYLLYDLGGFVKGKYYTGAVLHIDPDGKTGTDEDYERYYNDKEKLVEMLGIEYQEDYTILQRR